MKKSKQSITKRRAKVKKQLKKLNKSRKKPSNSTSNPKRKQGQKKDFMSYRKAQQLIRKQKIKSKHQFEKWSSSKKRPADFPSNPRSVYKLQWKDWGIFLGTGRKKGQRKDFMSYRKAQQFIRKRKVETKNKFEKWSSSKKKAV